MATDNDSNTPYSILGRMIKGSPGDTKAWADFVSRYGQVIRLWCLERNVKEIDAQDLTQTVLVRLHRYLRSFDRSKGRFRDYLRSITGNVVKDYFKSRKRDVLANAQPVDAVPEPAQPETLAEQLRNEHEVELQLEAVKRGLARSSPKEGEVFRMKVDERRPALEVATSLGLGVSTVYKMLKRVEVKIAEEFTLLEEQGFGSS